MTDLKKMPSVCTQRCSQCLFSPNKIVSNRKRTKIIKECLEKDKPFLCHKGTIAGFENLYCRGFVETYPGYGQPIRLAKALRILGEVDPETLQKEMR